MKKIIILSITAISIINCNAVSVFGFGNNFQNGICRVDDANAVEKECKNGEVMLFLPSLFGNEQLPIIISAAFCDYEYPVVHNTGGVSCIFTDRRKKNWQKWFSKANVEQETAKSIHDNYDQHHSTKGSLYVHTNPPDAIVRILNIGPKFSQGMELSPGRYNVEVSSPGYVPRKLWINLVSKEDKKLDIQLTPEEQRKVNFSDIFSGRKINHKRQSKLIDHYRVEIVQKINKNCNYSDILDGVDKNLMASLVFKVMPDGEIRDVYFVNRSGNEYLDDSAYKAIVKTNPMPPHPKGLVEAFVSVGLRFTPEGIR